MTEEFSPKALVIVKRLLELIQMSIVNDVTHHRESPYLASMCLRLLLHWHLENSQRFGWSMLNGLEVTCPKSDFNLRLGHCQHKKGLVNGSLFLLFFLPKQHATFGNLFPRSRKKSNKSSLVQFFPSRMSKRFTLVTCHNDNAISSILRHFSDFQKLLQQ